MKNFINWFKCSFGFHDWVYNDEKRNRARYCARKKCNISQIASYDMAYGSTDWK